MMVIFQIPVTWNVLYFIPILLTLGLFTFGCSCFLMHYGVYVNDLSNVVAIITRMLFYITGIFYNLETRIPEVGALLNRYNPVAFLITAMRNCLIYSQTPLRKIMLVWFLVGLLLSFLGVWKIYREENSYVKSI
jgi:ABC-type polysaccharide/polyol phosphate export permease